MDQTSIVIIGFMGPQFFIGIKMKVIQLHIPTYLDVLVKEKLLGMPCIWRSPL
jgi:hypothetical protein